MEALFHPNKLEEIWHFFCRFYQVFRLLVSGFQEAFMGKSAHVILQKFQGRQGFSPVQAGARGRGASFFISGICYMLSVSPSQYQWQIKKNLGDPLLKMTKSRGW